MPSELSYHIDDELSSEMKGIPEKKLSNSMKLHKVSLIEFLYAISIEKLTFKSEHLFDLSNRLDLIADNEIVPAFSIVISSRIFFIRNRPYVSKLKFLKNKLKN